MNGILLCFSPFPPLVVDYLYLYFFYFRCVIDPESMFSKVKVQSAIDIYVTAPNDGVDVNQVLHSVEKMRNKSLNVDDDDEIDTDDYKRSMG